MLFRKRKEKETRLSGRVLLALRVAEQALCKCLESPEVGWTHMNINQGPSNGRDEEDYSVFIQGNFYGVGARVYKGSVLVNMHLDQEEWKSTSAHILWDEPQPLFPEARFGIAYITDYQASRGPHGGYSGDIPSLSSKRLIQV